MMAENSNIEWTDATWNIITGCDMVDAGCTNCYAMQLAGSRLRHHPSRKGLTRVTGGRAKWTGEVRFNEGWLDQPLRWSRPRRIFVCAHGDLFHPAVPDEWIDRVFAVMALATQHTFQVLTKRPERAAAYLRRVSAQALIEIWAAEAGKIGGDEAAVRVLQNDRTALRNVWLGTSVSDQTSADLRIPHLLAAPAAVRFLSAEPLLGPLDLGTIWLRSFGQRGSDLSNRLGDYVQPLRGNFTDSPKINWVIVGGESGAHARVWPGLADAARSIRDQCKAAGVAFFMKQMAGARKASMPPIPDDLMVREMPHAQR